MAMLLAVSNPRERMLAQLTHRLHRFSAHGQPERFLAANIAIGLGHFLVLFNGGAYLPMIPRIAASLGRNPVYGDWTQDLYFLALGLAMPLGRWASQHWGDRDGLLACFAAIFLASVVNAGSTDYGPFLLARLVAGFAGGLSIPLSLNILLRHYHADVRDHGLLLWGVAAITPFAFGPFLGGWIDDAWGWRWLFLLNLPLLLASFLGLLFWEEDSPRTSPVPMDWLGYALLCLTFLTMEMTLNLGSMDNWWRSLEIRALSFLALILLGTTILWLRRHPLPAIDAELFTHANLRIAALGLFLTAVVFQGTLALLVVQYQLSFGYSARAVGEILLSMAIFAPLSATFSHWYLGRHDPRPLAVAAMLLLAGGAFWLSSYDLPVSPDSLVWPPLLVGLGLGGAFATWARIGLWGLAGATEQRAAALLNLLRSGGQAMGIPIVAGLWERRLDLHRHFLVEDRGSNLAFWQSARARLNPSLGTLGSRQYLAGQIHQHAAMLAFNEIFYLAAWIFLILGGWSLLARKVPASPESVAEHVAIAELVEP